jgi:N-acylneuraminate cytidylyltransferase
MGIKLAAVIPARSGSQRVKNKNIRLLAGHPLIAYSIVLAQQSSIFDKIYCTTDSPLIGEIANWYGCDEVIYRPESISTSLSPDIDWIEHFLSHTKINHEYFSILRITSPLKSESSLISAFTALQNENADSIRAVTKVREHPGKMWQFTKEGSSEMTPLLDPQIQNGVAWHARQYQDLPEVYLQTSSFEIIRTKSVQKFKTREGRKILGFPLSYPETLTIDYEDEFWKMEMLVKDKLIALPEIRIEPYVNKHGEN